MIYGLSRQIQDGFFHQTNEYNFMFSLIWMKTEQILTVIITGKYKFNNNNKLQKALIQQGKRNPINV